MRAAATLVLLSALLAPAAAHAHARLVRADPPDLCPRPSAADARCATGAVLDTPPRSIHLTFNESVAPIGRGVRVVGPNGQPVERGPARVDGRDLIVDIEAATPGTYVVSWRVVSTDTQPERGRYVFSVGRPTPVTTPAGSATPGADAAGFTLGLLARVLHFLGYAGVFGTLAFQHVVLRPLGRESDVEDALWRLVRAGLIVLVVAEPLAILAQALRLGSLAAPDVLADVLESRVALVASQRLGVALLVWTMTPLLRGGSALAARLTLGFGVALAVVDGQVVHAIDVRPPWAGLATNALHLVAMGAWLGALAALVVVWSRPDARAWRIEAAVRVGRIAAAAVALLVVSGVTLSAQHLGRVSDLRATPYGRLVLAKAGLLALALVLALSARRRERWWRAELIALAGLLALAAALVSLPPPA